MADARKDRRTLLSLKIRYKSATLEDFIERYSMDISRGGVFIKAKKPLAVGTLLKFEFMLRDQSTLIHGVGRVVWRREEAESDEHNPPGMGIKFIKMDPDSRSVVQRIVEDRVRPGVFDHGKEGVPSEPAPASDQTKVRHVSEFLASALEEGGAGAATTREARAGAERARQMSNDMSAARGAFSTAGDSQARRGISDAPSRGAMSAFGGSSGRMQSSAAPAMDEYDAADDFLDDETTKVQELPSTSEFPDAAATVIASESPFVAEKRPTPVVPAGSRTGSPLEDAVPDLFGPDSFGPAPGELIDASLLDPAVATVPPKASALPRGAVPDAPGIPAEAFRVPKAPAPAGSQSPNAVEKSSRGGVLLVLFLLLLATAGVASWQLGLTDDLMSLVAPHLGWESDQAVLSTPRVVPQPAKPATAVEPVEEAVKSTAVAADAPSDAPAPASTESAPPKPTVPAATGLVKFRIVSVPSGAFVSVNRKGVGRAPIDLEYAPGTKLSIYSKARGHLARRHRMTVAADQPEVALVLSPLPWVVEIDTEPAGARASAVEAGETTTPGELTFKSMTETHKIVVSKDGYVTATKSVSRLNFVEERSRMAASVRVTLAKEGATKKAEKVEASAQPPPTEAAPAPAPASEPEAAAEPAPVEEAPAPSEPGSADAP